MKAMVFAAGLGTRLKPFTLSHPKALVDVGGKPMLQHVIERLRDQAGVSHMVVNVHHFASQIVDFLKANNNFNIDLRVSDETDMLLDTGGGIVAAASLLNSIGKADEPVIVHNADILSDFPIDSMQALHTNSNADATLLVQERNTLRYLLFDKNMRMHGWTNVKTAQVRPEGLETTDLAKLAFGGVHIISPKVIECLKDYNDMLTGEKNRDGVHKFSITDFYIDRCSELCFRGFTTPANNHWHDVGKPESLQAARDWLNRQDS